MGHKNQTGGDAEDDFTLGEGARVESATGGGGAPPVVQPNPTPKAVEPKAVEDGEGDDDAEAAKPAAPSVPKFNPSCALPVHKITPEEMNKNWDLQNARIRELRFQSLARSNPEFREVMEENAALKKRVAELEAAAKK